MKKLALILILLIVATPLAISQWQFVKAFPDTSFKLPAGVNNGIAVDPEGKVWIQSYSYRNDSLAPGVYTGAIYVFYPNGTPAPFSPIKTLSAGGITDTLNGAGYGMRTDYQGNILSVKWSTRVWRINYKTGQGMNRVWNPISGYTSSIARVADDSLGEVFVAPVLPGGAVAVLNPDFSPAGNVASSVDGYGRDILVSKNGNDVYVPRFTLRKVYVYHSDNGPLGPYVLQDSILTQFVVETMAWDPKTGWMWVGSGNTTSGLPDPPYSPYAWYAYDLATKTIVDSIKWVGDVSLDPRPRGIAFSPTGDTVYVAAFNISDVTPVEMFVRRLPPPASWSFISNTGSNATIAVPTAINPRIESQPLRTGDAVGVFFSRNDSLICAGYSIWQEGQNMAITAWGDDQQTPLFKDGFAEGELIRYKIWDAHAGREYNAAVTYATGGTTFTTNGIYVLSSLVGTTNVSHGIALPRGWNMISSYLAPQDSTLDTVLAKIRPRMVIMKNGLGQVYWPALGINTIGKWNYHHGYQIYMQSEDTLVVTGVALVPESTPIALVQGWNMIGYLRGNAMRCDSALAGIVSKLVIAKNGTGQVYWPAYGINTIGSMMPGQGYQMYLTQAGTLTYPPNSAPALRLAKQHEVAEANEVTSPVHYRLAVSNTGANATLLVESPQLKDGDEIGVWTAKKLLVGSGVITQGRAVLAVWGDNSITEDITEGAVDGEMLTLTVWSNGEQSERPLVISSLVDALTGEQIQDGLHYKTDAVWIARAGRAEPQELPTVFSLSQNYPNPFNPSTTISFDIPRHSHAKLVIYDVLGREVRTLVDEEKQPGRYSVTFDASNLPSGVYLYRMVAGNFSDVKKMVLVK